MSQIDSGIELPLRKKNPTIETLEVLMEVNPVSCTDTSNRSIQLLSLEDAAALLDLTPRGLRAMLYRRAIASTKVGRLRKVPLSAIEDYIKRNTVAAAEGR